MPIRRTRSDVVTRTLRAVESSVPTSWPRTRAVVGAARAATEVVANACEIADRERATRSWVRVGMDYAVPPDDPADLSARLATAQEGLAFFDEHLVGAREFLERRGREGRVVAKLVTSDVANLMNGAPAEHAEWQLFFVPDLGDIVEGTVLRTAQDGSYPGLLDEASLDEWLEQEGVDPQGAAFLHAEDNPLFLGRLNYGTAGSGLYTRVPDYAERLGHAYDTRDVKRVVVTDPDKVRNAIRALYAQLPGTYAVSGTCHQAAVVVARELGIDPVEDTARVIDGMWFTRLRYGRSG